MSNLSLSLATAGQALGVFQCALDVVQNNITNAGTAGYAEQSLSIQAQPFDLASGLAGGIAGLKLDSSRDTLAEEEVQRQLQSLGFLQAQSDITARIEGLFDVSGSSGVSADFNALLQSFSSWSASPTSDACRRAVLGAADSLAASVRSLAQGLQSISNVVSAQVGSTIGEINRITGEIRDYNLEQGASRSTDPARDARLYANLEELSGLVNFELVKAQDGTVTLLLPGGSPLVAGTEQYAISAELAADGQPAILDSKGSDITEQIQGGRLGGELDIRNRLLPSLIGGGGQTGSLNLFAKSLADTVNGILQSGFTSIEANSDHGQALFTYDPNSAAATFARNSAVEAKDLAPVDADGNANGNALALAALSQLSPAELGTGFTDYFSGITAAVGTESATAADNCDAQQAVVAQTRTLRDKTSGVSLDEQAVMLLQFQRNYQAVAKLLTTIDSLLDTTIDLIRT